MGKRGKVTTKSPHHLSQPIKPRSPHDSDSSIYILGNMMALSAWRPKEDGTVFFNNCPLADRGILRQKIRSCRDIVGGSDCRQVGLFTLAAFRRIPVERQNLGGSTLSFLAFLKNRS